jgi:uncharacterized protein (TIGR02594 family)
MTINFNMLQQLAGPKVVGQIAPAPSSGGEDIGQFLSGLSNLAGAFTAIKQGPSQGNFQGSGVNPQYVQNAVTNPSANTSDSRLSQVVGNSDIFKNAMMQMGLKEGNPTLTQYLNKANPNLDPSVTPWCAGFVGSVLNTSGLKGTGSLGAKSYLKYGEATENPSQGDIVVLNRGSDPSLGHVGFVQSIDREKGTVSVVGGNQGNSVSVKNFPLSQVAGFRVAPTGQQVQKFAQQNNISHPEQLRNLPNQRAAANDLQHVMNGIANVESGGAKDPYGVMSKASKNGDRAYGKYQIMGNNIPSWTREATGIPMSAQQFLADPDAQERTAKFHIQRNLEKYGNVDDVFSTWFSGRPVKKAGNARDVYGTSVPDYLKKANQGYLQSKSGMALNEQNGSMPNDLPRAPIPLAPKQQSTPQGPLNPFQAMLAQNQPQPQAPMQRPPMQGMQQAGDPSQQQAPQVAGPINWGLLQSILQQRGMA